MEDEPKGERMRKMRAPEPSVNLPIDQTCSEK